MGLLLCQVQFLSKFYQHARAGVVGKNKRNSIFEEVFVVQTKNSSKCQLQWGGTPQWVPKLCSKADEPRQKIGPNSWKSR